MEDRDGGGLRVWSEDLPGLILSGPDKKVVCNAIAPAICRLLERKGLVGVTAHPETPLHQLLQHASPRDVDVHVQHERFVIELAHAA
jgi:hypothetical protein